VRWLTPCFWHAPKKWQISQLAMFDDTQGWWSNHPFSEFHDSHFSWTLKITIESPLKTLNRIESYLYKAPLNHQYMQFTPYGQFPIFSEFPQTPPAPGHRRHGIPALCSEGDTLGANFSMPRKTHKTRPEAPPALAQPWTRIKSCRSTLAD
jgi:hypothetical protein